LQAAATDNGLNIALPNSIALHWPTFFIFSMRRRCKPCSNRQRSLHPHLWYPWRWDANRALALLRFHSGKSSAQIQRMRSDDLLASVFPMCGGLPGNIVGDFQIPDHPLVKEVMKDVLTEAMDHRRPQIAAARDRGRTHPLPAVDTAVHQQFSHEILNANPMLTWTMPRSKNGGRGRSRCAASCRNPCSRKWES